MMEMLIVERAMSNREPMLFAEKFRRSALAAIASSPKMSEPARKIASEFAGMICDGVSAIIATNGIAVETVGTLN
jgi:hypothetical protein